MTQVYALGTTFSTVYTEMKLHYAQDGTNLTNSESIITTMLTTIDAVNQQNNFTSTTVTDALYLFESFLSEDASFFTKFQTYGLAAKLV